MKVPLAEQIAEVKRELALRANVYPMMVAKGRLDEAAGARQTARLQAVLATLEWLDANRDAVVAASRGEAT